MPKRGRNIYTGRNQDGTLCLMSSIKSVVDDVTPVHDGPWSGATLELLRPSESRLKSCFNAEGLAYERFGMTNTKGGCDEDR